MHVLITFYDPWTIPTVTFTRTDPVARAEIHWDPKRPTGYIGAHAACTLAFEYDFKSDFPSCGGALHFLILYFHTCFHSGFWSNEIRHVSPQNKKEEKLERRTRGNSQKLQQSKFWVGERKKTLLTITAILEEVTRKDWAKLAFLEIFKGQLDRVLKNLICPWSLLSLEQRI